MFELDLVFLFFFLKKQDIIDINSKGEKYEILHF